MCKKVASRVSILGRIRSFVTEEAATLVHNALILPLFDNCDIAWSNLLQKDIDRLQRLQNRVIVKKSSPKNLSADCRPTVDRQSADRLRKKKNCVKNEQLT